MNKNYLGADDLVNNPTTRIPVCLCLDTSSSMLEIIGGTYRDLGRTEFRDGKLYNIVEGGETKLDRLTEGVNIFYQAIKDDEIARYSCEISLVTFDDFAQVKEGFQTVEHKEKPNFETGDNTQLGSGVLKAIEVLEQRKKEYANSGVDYFQPWLVIMSDGNPTDQSSVIVAQQRTKQLEANKKLVIFSVGIGDDANLDVLSGFSNTKRALPLKDMNFKKFFEWLSKSVSAVSKSIPGEKVTLDVDGIKDWADI